MFPSPDLYSPGNVVFEPLLGLCQVMRWTEETILNVRQHFCELRSLESPSLFKIPILQMLSRGIRPLMAPVQIEGLLNCEDQAVIFGARENYIQRIRRWTRRIRSNRACGSYEFLREWQGLVEQGGRINDRETQFHEQVLRALTQEISQVLQISLPSAGLRLDGWLCARAVPA